MSAAGCHGSLDRKAGWNGGMGSASMNIAEAERLVAMTSKQQDRACRTERMR